MSKVEHGSGSYCTSISGGEKIYICRKLTAEDIWRRMDGLDRKGRFAFISRNNFVRMSIGHEFSNSVRREDFRKQMRV